MSKAFVVIAATGEGKSTLVKQITAGKPLFVYDVNGEYNDLSSDLNQPRCKYFGSVKDFIKVAGNKHNGTYCVFEEATGFFHGKSEQETRLFLIGKRHPIEQGGRNAIFLFHTIQTVPPFLLDTADYIVLFRTGDDINAVKRKRAKLVAPFLKLQRMPKHSKIIIKNT